MRRRDDDAQRQPKQQQQNTPTHLLSTSSRHCWTTTGSGSPALNQRKTSKQLSSTTTTTAKVVLAGGGGGGGGGALGAGREQQRYAASDKQMPPNAAFQKESVITGNGHSIIGTTTTITQQQHMLVLDPLVVVPPPPPPPPSSISSCASPLSTSCSTSSSTLSSSINATTTAAAASGMPASAKTGHPPPNRSNRPSLLFDFPSSCSSSSNKPPTSFNAIPSSSSPVPSPSQWRLPTAAAPSSPSASSIATIVGGNNSASAALSVAAVDRAMPKSALLISKCQVFLKNTGSYTNLRFSQHRHLEQSDSTESGGRYEEIQTPRTIEKLEDEEEEEQRSSARTSCSDLRPTTCGALEHTVEGGKQQPNAKNDDGTSTRRRHNNSNNAVGACIFNFENIPLGEKFEESEVMETIERMLQLIGETLEHEQEGNMNGNAVQEIETNGMNVADEADATDDQAEENSPKDECQNLPLGNDGVDHHDQLATVQRTGTEMNSKGNEAQQQQEEDNIRHSATKDKTTAATDVDAADELQSTTAAIQNEQVVIDDEAEEKADDNDGDDGDCILAFLHKKGGTGTTDDGMDGSQQRSDSATTTTTRTVKVDWHFDASERNQTCSMCWPLPSTQSCSLQIAEQKNEDLLPLNKGILKEHENVEESLHGEKSEISETQESKEKAEDEKQTDSSNEAKSPIKDGNDRRQLSEPKTAMAPTDEDHDEKRQGIDADNDATEQQMKAQNLTEQQVNNILSSENAIPAESVPPLQLPSVKIDDQQSEASTKTTVAVAASKKSSMKRRAHPPPSPLPSIQALADMHLHQHDHPGTSAATNASPLSSCCSSIASTSRVATTATVHSVAHNQHQSSPRPSDGSSSIVSRVIERLHIAGMQLRNMKCSRTDALLAVAIRMDGRELFRTAAVQLHGNSCVIGEEFCMEEMPRHFQCLQLSLFELVDGARAQRLVGRVRLGRKELLELGQGNDTAMDKENTLNGMKQQQQQQKEEQQQQHCWLPITPIRPLMQFSEVLGSLCVQLEWNEQTKVLTLSVLDFTIWTLAGNAENPLERYCREGAATPGRLHLKLCVAFGRTGFTAMQRIRLSERRGLEQARFDCSPFVVGPSTSFNIANTTINTSTGNFFLPPPPPPNAAYNAATSPRANNNNSDHQSMVGGPEWLSGVSNCSSPNCATTPSWGRSGAGSGMQQHSPRHNSSFRQHFHFPPPSPLSKGSSGGGGGLLTPSGRTSATGQQQQQSQLHGMMSVSSTASPLPAWMHEPRVHIKLYGTANAVGGGGMGATDKQDCYCGSVRIALDPVRMQPRDACQRGPNWFNINNSHHQHMPPENTMGEIRLKFWYNTDEVLPFVHYQPLYLNLIRSLNVTPYSHSLISLIQCLPIDIEKLAKPLMKIFIHSNQIHLFFRLICSEYLSTCRDVNTLFRSQSLASKVMYEMMKFVGHKYLIASLKPLIDLIFAERKSCEIDPSKLKPGESLERNFCNITVYAELAFSRVIDSRQRCPQALRELFAELRQVVQEYFPGREDVSRLAVSSFLIMRFFAAAILNPKLFALKLETPDIDVSRTLVLVSKILQRLANCVVSAHPLTTKEQWLSPVLQRFLDDTHKSAMINFLDDVSTTSTNQRVEMNGNNAPSTAGKLQIQSTRSDGCAETMMINNENALPPNTPTTFSCESNVLKSGYLIERRFGSVKKRSFKNFIHPKRRLVVLTENTLNWHKTSAKESAHMINSLNMSGEQQNIGGAAREQQQQKSQIHLAEVTSVNPIVNTKNSFRVATVNTEVHFQANNDAEMNEWIILIQKQQRRHLMLLNRPCEYSQMSTVQAADEVNIERELHMVYTQLAGHFDTLCQWGWCCRHGECTRCGSNSDEQQPKQQQHQQNI